MATSSLPKSDVSLELLDRDDLMRLVSTLMNGGIVLNFHGKRVAQEIDKKVRPRQTLIRKEFSVGRPEEQARNMIIEGENLQAMVTLYKERGQVDLILTDPPYNTGGQFRYNDKWDSDPNDPDLGQVVAVDELGGARHHHRVVGQWPKGIVLLNRLDRFDGAPFGIENRTGLVKQIDRAAATDTTARLVRLVDAYTIEIDVCPCSFASRLIWASKLTSSQGVRP